MYATFHLWQKYCEVKVTQKKKWSSPFLLPVQAHVFTVVDFVARFTHPLYCGFSYSIIPPTLDPHTYIILCHPGWIIFLRFTASLNKTLLSLSVLGIDWFLFHNRGAGPHSSLQNGGHSVLTYHMQGRRQRIAVYLYHLETLTYIICYVFTFNHSWNKKYSTKT
jgi:hypothetical protein